MFEIALRCEILVNLSLGKSISISFGLRSPEPARKKFERFIYCDDKLRKLWTSACVSHCRVIRRWKSISKRELAKSLNFIRMANCDRFVLSQQSDLGNKAARSLKTSSSSVKSVDAKHQSSLRRRMSSFTRHNTWFRAYVNFSLYVNNYSPCKSKRHKNWLQFKFPMSDGTSFEFFFFHDVSLDVFKHRRHFGQHLSTYSAITMCIAVIDMLLNHVCTQKLRQMNKKRSTRVTFSFVLRVNGRKNRTWKDFFSNTQRSEDFFMFYSLTHLWTFFSAYDWNGFYVFARLSFHENLKQKSRSK